MLQGMKLVIIRCPGTSGVTKHRTRCTGLKIYRKSFCMDHRARAARLPYRNNTCINKCAAYSV